MAVLFIGEHVLKKAGDLATTQLRQTTEMLSKACLVHCPYLVEDHLALLALEGDIDAARVVPRHGSHRSDDDRPDVSVHLIW